MSARQRRSGPSADHADRSLDLQGGTDWLISHGTCAWWYRAGAPSTEGLTEDEARLVSEESFALLVVALTAADVRWVDEPDLVSRAELKLYQLSIAARLGVQTPATLVTNDEHAARQFASAGK